MFKLDNWFFYNSKFSIFLSLKILELMQILSLVSRYQLVGRVFRELVFGDFGVISFYSFMDQRVVDFFRIFSISSRFSLVWLSFENIFIFFVKDQDFIGRQFINISSYFIYIDSFNFFNSMVEVFCVVELFMEVKVKIVDKFVRGFLKIRYLYIFFVDYIF